MVVDLPEPEEPTSAVTVPGSAWKEMSCSTVAFAIVAETYVFEIDVAVDIVREVWCGRGPDLLGARRGFPGSLQSGQRFGELGSDLERSA